VIPHDRGIAWTGRASNPLDFASLLSAALDLTYYVLPRRIVSIKRFQPFPNRFGLLKLALVTEIPCLL